MKRLEFILSFVLLVSLYLITIPLSVIWKLFHGGPKSEDKQPIITNGRPALRLVK